MLAIRNPSRYDQVYGKKGESVNGEVGGDSEVRRGGDLQLGGRFVKGSVAGSASCKNKIISNGRSQRQEGKWRGGVKRYGY